MPIYCYSTKSGITVTVPFPLGEAPKFVTLSLPGGRSVGAARDFRAEQVAVPPTKGWPLECYASGVNAAQADDLRAEFKRLKIPTEVTDDGNPVYRNAQHRKRALKARGFYDRAAYE